MEGVMVSTGSFTRPDIQHIAVLNVAVQQYPQLSSLACVQ